MKKLYPKLFLVLFSTLFSVVFWEIALRYISFGPVGDDSADLISEEKMATDWLSGWLQQHGIPFLNIADVFKTHNWEEMFHDSTHPTPKGHAVIAKAVYPLINH